VRISPTRKVAASRAAAKQATKQVPAAPRTAADETP
jgi:hypothetical protein